MDAAGITKEISTREDDFKTLWDRMDSDFNRWALRGPIGATILKTSGTTVEIKRGTRKEDITIIANHPRTFCDNVQAVLSSSERQIAVRMAEVEGEDKREEMGKLERLFEFAFEKADERLARLLLPSLNDQLWWYSMVRGWVAGSFLVYKGDGDNVTFDFRALDPRWLTYRLGSNGLLWTASKSFRSPEELKDEYGKIIDERKWYKFWEKSKKSFEVIDYWRDEGNGKKINAVICSNEFLKEPESYDMVSMPVLVAPVPTRPPIVGESDEMGGYGESILAPNRDIDDLLNDMGSIWASHAKRLSEQPLINYRGDQGIELKDTRHYAGGVMNLVAGQNKIEPTPMQEISPTLVNLVNWLDAMRVSGSMPDIDIGRPPPSGTLYNLVQETSNRVFNPQLRNLSSFYAGGCRLTEEQLLIGGIGKEKIKKVKVQIEEKKKYYETQVKPVDLKKPHIIKVEFTARTPWTQMDTYQVAQMAQQLGLPDGFIQEHIVKVPDPKGLGDLAAIEMAEHSPKLAMLRAIDALMKQGREDEAGQLKRDMYNMEVQEGVQPGLAGEAEGAVGEAITPEV